MDNGHERKSIEVQMTRPFSSMANIALAFAVFSGIQSPNAENGHG
jgi:hypothetical protein